MIRGLVLARANVNHVDCVNETALFWARDRQTCKTLLEVGINPLTASRRTKRSCCAAEVDIRAGTNWLSDEKALNERRKYLGEVSSLFPRAKTRAQYGHIFVGDCVYMVHLGNKATDAEPLVRMEQEFADDHIAFLDPSRKIDRAAWCHHLGITGDVSHRREVIRSVLEGGQLSCGRLPPDRRWTLVCCQYPQGEVVGYVHFSLKEREASPTRGDDGSPLSKVARTGEPTRYLSIGYLKVDRRHMQRGIASLLLAAVPRHLVKLAGRLRKAEPRLFPASGTLTPFLQCISLSVVSLNHAAHPLYRKFGFKVDEEAGSDVIPGTSVRWCSMSRNSQDDIETLIENWDAVLLGRSC